MKPANSLDMRLPAAFFLLVAALHAQDTIYINGTDSNDG